MTNLAISVCFDDFRGREKYKKRGGGASLELFEPEPEWLKKSGSQRSEKKTEPRGAPGLEWMPERAPGKSAESLRPKLFCRHT